MQNKVAIFIVNYNSNAVLARCLECVVGQQFIASDIFVLDNGSKDPIPEDYSLRFPSVFFSKAKIILVLRPGTICCYKNKRI